MTKTAKIAIFEGKGIRRHWNDTEEKWYFSVVDVVTVLTNSKNPRKYWNKLAERLRKEGSELVTKCHQLKMQATDGKYYLMNYLPQQVSGNMTVNRIQNLFKIPSLHLP